MTLLQTPGPAALPRVAVDVYKKRAPAYTMAARPKHGEGKAVKPGPADYNVGQVRQLLSSSPLLHKHSLHASPPSPEATPHLPCRERGQQRRALADLPFLSALPGDADQAPGACLHFWDPAFPLHNPPHRGIRQHSLEGCGEGEGRVANIPSPSDPISLHPVGLLPVILLDVSVRSKSLIN